MKPAALICYRPDMVAQICAWCPDKKTADEIALVRGYELNHTICAACAAKLLTDLPRKSSIVPDVRPATDAEIQRFRDWRPPS